ncbi:nuclease domain-containing protein [Wickerhamomyces ciferrii]|uniref:Nuclease domain-containing protein n=1 Tax=Wickerhamomyces ciferrii (strain ATCC 14091 / BCRC 22168 / CBS 111 / JCM 3599 / NBRC 0793 / NRRL Y-1031 F-60-10) TaxID=1206466 RepID=K0KS98_WICCF|nr:nuclease domain-containing protein [Wickerhamomyces ciferrii]CCH46041.1 nuclease domain-containing protein [Wickerhamomyces ciferrii]
MADLIKGRFRKDIKYKAIIDKVISGDRVVTHIYFDDGEEAELSTLIAGFRTPRSSDPKNGTAAEPFGDEAKKYIETRLVNQKVFVQFVGTSSTEVPIIKIYHPAGNISEKIIASGLAEVADWQSSLIGAEGMVILRNAEKQAKAGGKGLWKSLVKPTTTTSTTSKSASTFKIGSTIEGTIDRIISPDAYSIGLQNGTQQTVYLSSIRSPRATDPSAPFLPQAREFVRKYIGKKVSILTDAFRNENPLVTITLPNGKNLAETIVLNGYATVIKHRRGDDDRSSAWDALIEAETIATKEKKGIYSNKVPEPEKIIEASENSQRAKIHLRTLQNQLKIQGIVEYVISPNRIRILLPRENIRLVLVFAGLLSLSKESPISQKVIDYSNKHILQRDVSIELFDVDKVGGFIGNLYVKGNNHPYQIELLKLGYAQIHDGSVSKTKFEDQFYDAEEEAQDSRKGVWINWDPEEEERKFQEEEEKRRAKYEEKIAKTKKANAFDDDEDDISHLPEAVRKLVIKK